MTELQNRLSAERLAVDTLYEAFNRKNPDLLDRALTADWLDIPLAPDQAPGPEGLKSIIRDVIRAFPDVTVTIRYLMQQPGQIAVRAELAGTHQGPLFGIPATGRQVRFGIHEFHRLDGRLITQTWHMEDWLNCFMQLGQFPAMP